jgi:hypothetical protein
MTSGSGLPKNGVRLNRARGIDDKRLAQRDRQWGLLTHRADVTAGGVSHETIINAIRETNCALAGTVLPVEDRGMNSLSLVLALMAGCCLLRPEPLAAQVPAAGAPPFEMDKRYSADLTIITKDGMTIQSKTYVDGDKMRGQMSMNGMDMATIVRKDKQKIYQVMDAQKMSMEMDYDPAKFMQGKTAAAFGPTGTFQLVGPETVDGVASTKYKVTSDKTKDVFFFWLDLAHKVPVQMASENGSFTVKWKNYKSGPQDAALFEVPAGYQVMAMPAMPGMPGAMGGDGQ